MAESEGFLVFSFDSCSKLPSLKFVLVYDIQQWMVVVPVYPHCQPSQSVIKIFKFCQSDWRKLNIYKMNDFGLYIYVIFSFFSIPFAQFSIIDWF